MALEEPHKVHYYYGSLLNDYNKNRSTELFADDDYPGLYFAVHHITSRARKSAGKDGRLNEWTFHLGLLVKRQIAPELNKGTTLNDRKFLEVMKRIDQGFAEAYRVATGVLTQLKLATNQNRIPDVTKTLLSEIGRVTAKPRAGAQDAVAATAPAVLALTDGNYIGHVHSVDVSGKRIKLKYGPYLIDGKAANADALILKPGDRASFSVAKSLVTVSAPSKEP